MELSPKAKPSLGSCFTHSTVAEEQGQHLLVLPVAWEHGSWHHLPYFHIPSSTQPSVHIISYSLGHFFFIFIFCHFESFCSDLITLMEGKSKHHRHTFSQALLFPLLPPSTYFIGRDSSLCPKLQKSPSVALKLHWILFPSVNGLWLAGAIYCCLWRQNSASLGVGQTQESHWLGWKLSYDTTGTNYIVSLYGNISSLSSLGCFENEMS